MTKYHVAAPSARTYDGRVYASKAEAHYARLLDLRQRAGEVAAWRTQIAIPLIVNGERVCTYVADFLVTFPDGSSEYVEVKGFETPVWKVKKKLLAACRPDVRLRIVRVERSGAFAH